MFQRNIDKMVTEQVFKSSVMDDQGQPTTTAAPEGTNEATLTAVVVKRLINEQGLTVRQARKALLSGARLTDQEVLRLYVS